MNYYVCKYCGKNFQANNKGRIFCSMFCSNKSKWSKGKLGRPRKGIIKKCLWCDAEFYIKPSHANKTSCCSQSCAAKYRYHVKKDFRHLKLFPPSKYKIKKIYKNSGGISEHRVVAEKKIGRKLLKSEEVHHIDKNHLNNSPDNLQVMSKKEHRRLHALDRLYNIFT